VRLDRLNDAAAKRNVRLEARIRPHAENDLELPREKVAANAEEAS